MAKRFTDTSKYKKPFYRSLPGAYKLFYDFLYHDCDHAGVWIVDIEIAQRYVGSDMPIDRMQALKLFNSDEVRIIEFDGGKKWFIPLFITFQYGQLSEKNRAHTSVIQILKKFNLIDDNLKLTDPPSNTSQSPLEAPCEGAKEKDKDKEQEKETGNGKRTSFGKSENLFSNPSPSQDESIIGQMWGVWKTTFPKYTADRDSDFEGLGKIFAFMCRQNGTKNHDPTDNEFQIKFLNTFQILADEVAKESFWINKPIKSIANNIQEFYNKIKNPIDATPKQQNGRTSKIDDNILKQKLAAKRGEWQQGGG
jgi:hypothetical protein